MKLTSVHEYGTFLKALNQLPWEQYLHDYIFELHMTKNLYIAIKTCFISRISNNAQNSQEHKQTAIYLSWICHCFNSFNTRPIQILMHMSRLRELAISHIFLHDTSWVKWWWTPSISFSLGCRVAWLSEKPQADGDSSSISLDISVPFPTPEVH